MIDTHEVAPETLNTLSDCRYVLEHPKLPFISYPYEWCFSALRAAALLQLDLLTEALERDIMLSDASAYNIQFDGSKPVFIDVLSFRPYSDGEYWTAHQQFCDQFLNPLLLSAKGGIGFNAWFRGNIEGITSQDLNQLLPWFRKLSLRVVMHVTLPVRLQSGTRRNTAARLDNVARRSLPRSSLSNMISSLRSWIASLSLPSQKRGDWNSYETVNSYDNQATQTKEEFTRRFASAVKPTILWDIGCNTGKYADIALQAGAVKAIGFDSDAEAVETAFARSAKTGTSFLPLVLDLANPSPGQGWRGIERKSLLDRANADGMIAYAVLHHLSIGRNIPLAEAVSWLTDIAPEGVIEFVEKEDPMVRQMLRLRTDIFDDYHRDAFLAEIRKRAEIVETCEVIKGRRLLVWYRRRGT